RGDPAAGSGAAGGSGRARGGDPSAAGHDRIRRGSGRPGQGAPHHESHRPLVGRHRGLHPGVRHAGHALPLHQRRGMAGPGQHPDGRGDRPPASAAATGARHGGPPGRQRRDPGLVSALVFAALDAFAERAGVDHTPEALDLHSVLITEEDTTVDGSDPGDPDVFPMTWSPFHCLEELYEPRAFAAEHGSVIGLGHRPTERWYRARCGDHIIDGMAVPHEETVTLATRMPGIEIGFIYRIPPAARAALAAHPERDVADAWKTRRLCPPWTTDISGQDRVGVLLCSRRFGELWMGFETDVELGLRYGTNATQLQVAAGVLAGWAQLGRRT